MEIVQELFNMRDEEYKSFHSRLMPTVNPDRVIGVRAPLLKAFAKRKDMDFSEFLTHLPHSYYEENNLHAFIINGISDYDRCIFMVDTFLPYVDNWATCDGLRPVCFRKNKEKLYLKILEWIKSGHLYTVRFAIEMLMVHFLDEDFKTEHLKIVSNIKSDEYYLNMMIAWYFATALAKKWDYAVKYIENGTLSDTVIKMTLRKAFDSFRITDEQKKHLRKITKN